MRRSLPVVFAIVLLSACSDETVAGGMGSASVTAAIATATTAAAVTASVATPAPTTAAASTTTTTAAPGSGAVVKLALGDLKFSSKGKVGFTLKVDGTIGGPDGSPIGSLSEHGTMTKSTGALVAKLHADGSVTGADGGKLPMTIDDDGVLTLGDKILKFNDAGGVEGGSPGAPGMAVEGVTPETYRAAMFVLGVMLTPIAAAPGRAPAPAPGPGPAPAPPAK